MQLPPNSQLATLTFAILQKLSKCKVHSDWTIPITPRFSRWLVGKEDCVTNQKSICISLQGRLIPNNFFYHFYHMGYLPFITLLDIHRGEERQCGSNISKTRKTASCPRSGLKTEVQSSFFKQLQRVQSTWMKHSFECSKQLQKSLIILFLGEIQSKSSIF